MREIREMLERQARWQSTRKSLSWAEKVRLVESVRESVIAWRSGGRAQASSDKQMTARNPMATGRAPE